MPDHNPELVNVLERLVREALWKTVHLKVETLHEKSRTVPPENARELNEVQEYWADASGRRHLDFRQDTLPDGLRVHRAGFSDGSKCWDIWYSNKDVERQGAVHVDYPFMDEVKYGFSQAPPPLMYSYVGLTPLHEALPDAEPMGKGDVMGRPCLVYHFKNAGSPTAPQSLVYHLDRKTSVPLRVAAYKDPDRVRDALPSWVWEAASLDRVGERHVPLNSTYTSYWIHPGGNEKLTGDVDLFHKIRVVEAEFDAPLSASVFKPVIQPGVTVTDDVAHRYYTTPGGVKDQAPKAETAAGEPVRVSEPGGGFPFAGAGIALSLGVLATAVLLRWRRG